MNDLIRPSLYNAYHEIVPTVRRGGSMVADVVGPVCESGDFLARDRVMGRVRPGDLLAVMSAGAYGFSMASNYNGRPRAAEVIVSGSRARLARRRESLADLARGETR
jgi:diaminopimelate decarboxylase